MIGLQNDLTVLHPTPEPPSRRFSPNGIGDLHDGRQLEPVSGSTTWRHQLDAGDLRGLNGDAALELNDLTVQQIACMTGELAREIGRLENRLTQQTRQLDELRSDRSRLRLRISELEFTERVMRPPRFSAFVLRITIVIVAAAILAAMIGAALPWVSISRGPDLVWIAITFIVGVVAGTASSVLTSERTSG
jgi:hypothetical protein